MEDQYTEPPMGVDDPNFRGVAKEINRAIDCSSVRISMENRTVNQVRDPGMNLGGELINSRSKSQKVIKITNW
jgi:hypothetical protein